METPLTTQLRWLFEKKIKTLEIYYSHPYFFVSLTKTAYQLVSRTTHGRLLEWIPKLIYAAGFQSFFIPLLGLRFKLIYNSVVIFYHSCEQNL